MEYYVGLDVSLKEISICVVDRDGKTVARGVCPADPEGVAGWFRNRELTPRRIVHESGMLSLHQAQSRNFYQLTAETTHRGRYYHEYCMAISVTRDSPTGQGMTADAEETVIEALRDLARWLYRQLERDYDDLTCWDTARTRRSVPSPKT